MGILSAHGLFESLDICRLGTLWQIIRNPDLGFELLPVAGHEALKDAVKAIERCGLRSLNWARNWAASSGERGFPKGRMEMLWNAPDLGHGLTPE